MCGRVSQLLVFFFFNDTATTEIYTLSLHDALPICRAVEHRLDDPTRETARRDRLVSAWMPVAWWNDFGGVTLGLRQRSEEHTSELQSRLHLVCRLLLEKKKKKKSVILGNVRKIHYA